MKTIITIIALLFTLTTQAQLRYYIVPADSVASWIPISEASGIFNVVPRYNLANTEAIMRFLVSLAPNGSGLAYTGQEMLVIANTAPWTPPPALDTITSEIRIELARAKGNELTNNFFANIDQNVYDGTWTTNQGALAYSNYESIFGLLSEGLFDLIIKLEAAGQILPQGVVTQAMIDALINKLQLFEDNYIRPKPLKPKIMAITNNGTRVSLPSRYLPTGYTAPVITAVSGDELYVNRTDLTILKSAVENANAVTAFTALVAAVNVASAALVSVAFTTTETTTFYTDFIALDGNQDPETEESAYTSEAEAFTCTVVIYVQVVEVT